MEELLAQFSFVVTYAPLANEPTPPATEIDTHVIPPLADQDPLAEAARVTELSRGRKTCLFIPGTRFDALGTRHGRGGGWYDRFLAHVPSAWTRIGITKTVTPDALERQAWDEPVDYLFVLGDGTRVVETHAR